MKSKIDTPLGRLTASNFHTGDMSESKQSKWCSVRGCDYNPGEGWEFVNKRSRRHKYCPNHEEPSAEAHRTYKKLEKERVFVTYNDIDIKEAITLRRQWAEAYLLRPEDQENAHPAFIRLLDSLLQVPQASRATVATAKLKQFNQKYS